MLAMQAFDTRKEKSRGCDSSTHSQLQADRRARNFHWQIGFEWQYLVVGELLTLEVEWLGHQGACLQPWEKNRSNGGKHLMATKKKAAKKKKH